MCFNKSKYDKYSFLLANNNISMTDDKDQKEQTLYH